LPFWPLFLMHYEGVLQEKLQGKDGRKM